MVNFVQHFSATNTNKKTHSLSTPIFQRESDFNPLRRTFNPPVLQYFSIDNAQLVYNTHPKLFRHSFWCIHNAHDAN